LDLQDTSRVTRGTQEEEESPSSAEGVRPAPQWWQGKNGQVKAESPTKQGRKLAPEYRFSFACQGSAAYEAERLVAKASPVPFPVVLR